MRIKKQSMNRLTVCMLVLLFTGFFSFKSEQVVKKDEWKLEANRNSTKIKLETSLSEDEMKKEIKKIYDLWEIEVETDNNGNLVSKLFKVNRRKMRIIISFKDKELIIMAEKGLHSFNPDSENWRLAKKGSSQLGSIYWERIKIIADVISHNKMLFN